MINVSKTSNLANAEALDGANTHKGSSWLKEYWFILVLVAVALLIAGYMAMFFITHKKVADKPIYQLTAEANRNRLYASQLWLQQQHKKVHVSKGEIAHQQLKQLWQQPASQAKNSAVLLLTVSKNQQADMDKMLAWVERGGHLITFSQSMLKVPNQSTTDNKDADKQAEADDLTEKQHRYQLNENPLLIHLGIVHQQRYDAHQDLLSEIAETNSATQTGTQPSSASVTSATPKGCDKCNELQLASKVLMRLPMSSERDIDTPNGNFIGMVLNTKDLGGLVTEQFWQKFPKAKPIADYDWWKKSPQTQKDIQWQSVVNPLTTTEQRQFTTEVQNNPKISLPASEAILDVQMGQGRLTIINDNNVFINPKGFDINDLSDEPNDKDDKSDKGNKSETDENEAQASIHLNLSPNVSSSPSKSHVGQLLVQLPNYTANLAQMDNAYLLQYLLAKRGNVWLVPDIEVANLPTLLWQQLHWACLAFILLLVMGYLALPKRFGRTQVYQTDSQTNIFGYFDHVGQYLWQTDKAEQLVTANRERLLEKIVAYHPNLVKTVNVNVMQAVDKLEVCRVVADTVGIGRSQVAVALYDPWQNEREFLAMSRQFAVLNQFY
ncbi:MULTISPECIES: hypothetical protein [unclassified Moraxella]|uniref:hypothetical protein n=1 Tax=unclassified Moraxella TaxID=2685852 RepID=UPI003AF57E12